MWYFLYFIRLRFTGYFIVTFWNVFDVLNYTCHLLSIIIIFVKLWTIWNWGNSNKVNKFNNWKNKNKTQIRIWLLIRVGLISADSWNPKKSKGNRSDRIIMKCIYIYRFCNEGKKTFSSRAMLERHVQQRHSLEQGSQNTPIVRHSSLFIKKSNNEPFSLRC